MRGGGIRPRRVFSENIPAGAKVRGIGFAILSFLPLFDLNAMSARVQVHDLWKAYGGTPAACGVTFDVAAGEIFGLLGPNGAGKTTTIECMLGLRRPDRGSVRIAGIDARRHPRDMQQRIGAALQTNALQDKITPREALRLFGSFYREAETPDALLQRFTLEEQADAPFHTLSGGQRRRLALALAFVNRPEVVLLDEPTTGLDPASRRDLHRRILDMKAEGRTVLLTTHYMEEAETLCDRVAIMQRGRLVAQGAPRNLTESLGAAPSVRLETSAPLPPETFADIEGLRDLEQAGCTARFRAEAAHRALAALAERLEAAGATLVELHVRRATLEDALIEWTQNEGEAADEPHGGASS